MTNFFSYVTLDHKTSLKCQFFKIEIYASINKLSIDVWFVMIGQYLAEIQLFKSFDIFTVRNLQNIFIEHDLYLIS